MDQVLERLPIGSPLRTIPATARMEYNCNLIFRLAVHGPGWDGPRLQDQNKLVSWPPIRHSVAAEANSHGDARLQVVYSRTRRGGRVHRHASYYFRVGGFRMTAEPGTYRLAVEVREPDDIVGVVPPRAVYRAVHDVVVLPTPAEGEEDSADEAELLLEGYNPTELKFYETLQCCVALEAERLSRRNH
ncbi:hypothetical protein MAPG_09252 [Magnaporthiopsis poae ATCC 64411]|uniref:Uncharacterized protein n=1 Tax=Magnaporthiopsis poae (strain ATCC 64411 / 73-15) TaxID=644358 RepID=A0A0C4E9G7_MAGP6|nr:hypothetical protein MAPG_09252 [Magnaporthiopsis poae ATCC 64411]